MMMCLHGYAKQLDFHLSLTKSSFDLLRFPYTPADERCSLMFPNVIDLDILASDKYTFGMLNLNSISITLTPMVSLRRS